jgi:hypothetical protein
MGDCFAAGSDGNFDAPRNVSLPQQIQMPQAWCYSFETEMPGYIGLSTYVH